jgi:hypothetical protein
MWYFVAFIWIVLVAGIFWAYGRKRRRAASERERQLGALIAEARDVARVPPQALPLVPGPAAPLMRPDGATAGVCLRKARYLGRTDALIYMLFKTGLPDHAVFANVAMADVVEPAPSLQGIEREQNLRKLALYRLNLVVCDGKMEIVAAVVLEDTSSDAARVQFAESSLAGTGIRVVRLHAASLPRHHQVRALVYGSAGDGRNPC